MKTAEKQQNKKDMETKKECTGCKFFMLEYDDDRRSWPACAWGYSTSEGKDKCNKQEYDY